MKFSPKMMSLVLVVACLVGLVSCDSKEVAQNSPASVVDKKNDKIQSKKYCEQGDRAWGKGDFDVAIGYYGKAIDCDPRYVGAYRRRARIYSIIDEYDKAISDFTEMIKLEPNASGVYLTRADIYLVTCQYEKAIADCNKYIGFNLALHPGYYMRGQAHQKLGENDKAIADYTHIIEMKLTDEVGYIYPMLSYLERAKLYEQKGDHKAAKADRARAIELEPVRSRSPEVINE